MVLTDRARLRHVARRTNPAFVLILLARRFGWRAGAEIGVLKGKTLFLLLDAVPGLSMVAIDQWRTLPPRPDECAETYDHYDMALIEREVLERAVRYRDRCRLLKGDSVAMAPAVAAASLDFIFIDADHTEEGFRRDLIAWLPKVRPGGMALGHDNHFPTVRRVLDAELPGWADYGETVWGVEL